MKYEKPSAEMIDFGSGAFFMALSSNSTSPTSPPSYSNPEAALQSACHGYEAGKHGTKKFTCPSFSGYTDSPSPENHSVVTVGAYTFIYNGNHWTLQ